MPFNALGGDVNLELGGVGDEILSAVEADALLVQVRRSISGALLPQLVHEKLASSFARFGCARVERVVRTQVCGDRLHDDGEGLLGDDDVAVLSRGDEEVLCPVSDCHRDTEEEEEEDAHHV